MMRFAQRLTADFDVRVKTLIRTEPTSNVAITNNNPGSTPIGSVAADRRLRWTGLSRHGNGPD